MKTETVVKLIQQPNMFFGKVFGYKKAWIEVCSIILDGDKQYIYACKCDDIKDIAASKRKSKKEVLKFYNETKNDTAE